MALIDPHLRLRLSSNNFKIFKAILASLQKLGPQLMLSATPNEIIFSTIDSSNSAYMSVTCDADFFSDYSIFGCDNLQAVLLFKQLLPILKAQHVTEATLGLPVVETGSRLEVMLRCENELLKTYRFPATNDPVVAVESLENLPVNVTADPQAMNKILSSFHFGVKNVALIAHPQANTVGSTCVEIRSYLDIREGQVENALHTKISLNGDAAFLNYENTLDVAVEIIFKVKDFRPILSLSDSLKCYTRLSFMKQQNPLVVSTIDSHESGGLVRAKLILSTLPCKSSEIDDVPSGIGYQEAANQELDRGHFPTISDDDGFPGIASTPPEELQVGPSYRPGFISTAEAF